MGQFIKDREDLDGGGVILFINYIFGKFWVLVEIEVYFLVISKWCGFFKNILFCSFNRCSISLINF